MKIHNLHNPKSWPLFSLLASCLILGSFSSLLHAEKPLKDSQKKLRERVLNILDYGVVGDGETLNTESFQKAIDACADEGGGVLRVPSGEYVTGTIQIKSNVILSLEQGAFILGSTNHDDYPTENLRPSREGQSHTLLYAEDASNFSLEGLGTIDGRGTAKNFPKNAGPDGRDDRPRLVRFENCEHFTLSGLTYKNPGFWGIHLIDCRDVHLNGVTIRFHENQSNNDGFDIDACERVLIENCDIMAGDDGICLKSTLNPCRDITVRNCRVSSHTAPLKFGTSSTGGFINIDVSNCYFYDSPMGAIKLQIVDGGRMENIKISRIEMENVGCPIFIRLGNRGRTYGENTHTGPNTGHGGSEGQPVGSVKGIHISDINATVHFEDRAANAARIAKIFKRDAEPKTGPLTDREKAKAGPIMIAGIPEHLIEDVVLENITISYPGGGTEEEAKNVPDEQINRYPEQFFFGVLPAWGAYIRHAKNIEFKNVVLTAREDDARERLVLDDVESFQEN